MSALPVTSVPTGNLRSMSENTVGEGPSGPGETPTTERRPAATERMGVPAVDAVLEEIESVGDLPVADQVAVYERAHEQLRRALETPAAGPADVARAVAGA